MEKNFAYCVNAYFEKAETTLRTNDVNVALKEFMDYVEDGVTCDVVNGFTGEVLAIANNPDHENYATDEWALMMGGMLYLYDLAEAQVEEEEDEPAEEVPVCAVRCDALPMDFADLLETLVAEGKAIKLGGLPS